MDNAILGFLRQARAEALIEGDRKRSRENSLVVTKIDEAILWQERDMQLKEPVLNQSDI